MKGAAVSLGPALALAAIVVLWTAGPAHAAACDAGVATIRWDGGGGTTSWHTAVNWDLDRIPASGDRVCIDTPGALVVFSAGTTALESFQVGEGAVLRLTGGTLSIAETSLVTTFEQSSGTLTGSGDLKVTESLSFLPASLSAFQTGTGSTFVNAGASLEVVGHPVFQGGRSLFVSGAGSWREGASGTRILVSAPSSIEVRFGGRLTIDHDGNRTIQGTGTVVVGAGGALVKTGAGTMTIGGSNALVNEGSVEVHEGTLALNGGGSAAGDFAVAAGASLSPIGGSYSLTEGSSIGGDGTLALGGLARLTVGPGAELGVPTFSLTGSPALVLETDVTVPTLRQSGGQVEGAGNLTVTGRIEILPATVDAFHSGAGTTTVAPGASLAIDSGLVVGAGRRFVLASGAAGSWTGGRVNLATSALLRVEGALTASDESSTMNGPGLVHVAAGGSFAKTNGGATAIVDVLNDGLFDVQAGVVEHEVSGLDFTNNGALRLDSDASTHFLRYRQTDSGVLETTIAGTTPGAGFGQLDALFPTAAVTLAGTIRATTAHGFVPAPDDVFPVVASSRVIIGTFATIDTPGYDVFYPFSPSHLRVELIPLVGGPDAVDDQVTVANGTLLAHAIDVLANDVHPRGDRLTIVDVSAPSHGEVVLDFGLTSRIDYDPEGLYTGPDSFTYTVQDSRGLTDTATVFVTLVQPRFTVSPGFARIGGEVSVEALDPCGGVNEVRFVLFEPGTATEVASLTPLLFPVGGSSPHWSGSPTLPGPVEPGAYELEAQCYSGGILFARYARVPFEVRAPVFSVSPAQAPVGGVVEVSGEACPGGSVVRFSLRRLGFTGEFTTLPVAADGSWGGTITLLAGAFDFPDYQMRAECLDASGEITTAYTEMPFAVVPGGFSVDPASAPVGGQVSVQSIDPCPGAHSVGFGLFAGGGVHGFFTRLPVAADGSWGGTITLRPSNNPPPPGSYEIRAACDGTHTDPDAFTTARYAGLPFEVRVPVFSVSPAQAPVGGRVDVSGEPCPGGSVVRFTLHRLSGVAAFTTLPVAADGTWAGTITLLSGPGAVDAFWQMRAECRDASGEVVAAYAELPFTVLPGAFTVDPAGAPVGGEVSVQSIDPCPGAHSVGFGLFAGGGVRGFFTRLPVAADGSWGGTITLRATPLDPVPGSYEIRAACDGTLADPSAFTSARYSALSFEVLDLTPPTITPDIQGTLGANGFYISDVTVSWTVVDPESPVSAQSGCEDQIVSTDTAGITVTCEATSAGGTASESVTIGRDVTAPTIQAPDGIAGVEATGPGGAVVSYDAQATDNLDPAPVLGCEPAPGSTFPLGLTTVTCTATDHAGTSATKTLDVEVVDTTPPTLSLPAPIEVDATTATGATVSYAASASDLVDSAPALSCSPASGTTFPIGTTTVRCSATDFSGNSAGGAFTVHVRGADEQVANLAHLIESLELPHGVENSLLDKLAAAEDALARANDSAACGALGAFLNYVEAQRGKSITDERATHLADDAARIRAVIGCG